VSEPSRREQQVLEKAERRRGRGSSPFARWRLRGWRDVDPLELAAVTEAVQAVLDDPEVWRVRNEEELLARYVKAGLEVSSLDEIAATVPLEAADKLALFGARPVGPVKQLRNRAIFRNRLPEECAQLVREAMKPLVHNAAVYGYRAGAPDERALALSVLAHGDGGIEAIALELVRAKSGARQFTGMRPGFADFNGWYLTRVTQESYWRYRERFVRDRA